MMLPIKRVGAKIPPTPPAPKVRALAITLKKTRPAKSAVTDQTLRQIKLKDIIFKDRLRISFDQVLDDIKALTIQWGYKINQDADSNTPNDQSFYGEAILSKNFCIRSYTSVK